MKTQHSLNLLAGALYAVMTLTHSAQASTHSYIASMRSSEEKHVFVSESVNGYYGLFESDPVPTGTDNAAMISNGKDRALWQGYDISTTIGVELMKFIQFSVAHSFMTLRSKESSFETMRGSQLSAASRLVFMSPIGNLEAGGGMLGSKYDYQRKLDDASYFGSGYFISAGWNYFMSYQISLFGEARLNYEHLVRDGGSDAVGNIDSNMTSLGAGFSLWL